MKKTVTIFFSILSIWSVSVSANTSAPVCIKILEDLGQIKLMDAKISQLSHRDNLKSELSTALLARNSFFQNINQNNEIKFSEYKDYFNKFKNECLNLTEDLPLCKKNIVLFLDTKKQLGTTLGQLTIDKFSEDEGYSSKFNQEHLVTFEKVAKVILANTIFSCPALTVVK